MNNVELLLHGWECCYDKEDWYPPLTDALKGLTAEQANWRPAGEHVNTIWENVQHLIFYKERLLKRMTGEEMEYPDATNDDTFAVESVSGEAWEMTLSRLQTVHLAIRERLAQWGENDFEHVYPNRTQSAGRWVNSLILHDAYHTGQIMFIRKLQGSWPSRRSFE
ncbi:DinB family protein [Paenibacillus sp. GCM10023248]|uniref:DinB family protein n=1 Tax=Bacillales TaxID=1385 RepID=UPI002378CBA6|nr:MULTISPECIES: DinB family protein [Bacillales]MDD9268109.1 DinB family protein [Paenibacillus sp. MAHUQ-63]MDR6879787.1 putative damage-inducible protein DinB [Bacillus sp. 3255]